MPKKRAEKLTRDEFLVACQEVGILRTQELKAKTLAVHNGVVEVLNQLFGGNKK